MTGWARGVRGTASVVVVLATVAALAATAATAQAAPLGHITPFSKGLQDNPLPGEIVAGPDGNLWFTDPGNTLSDHGRGGRRRADPEQPRDRPDHAAGKDHRVLQGPAGPRRQLPRSIAAGTGRRPVVHRCGGALDPEDPDDDEDCAEDSSTLTPAIGRITTSGCGHRVHDRSPQGQRAQRHRCRTRRQSVVHRPGQAAARSAPSRRAARSPRSRRACRERRSGPRSPRAPDGNMWFADAGKAPAIGRVAPGRPRSPNSRCISARTSTRTISPQGPDGNLWFTVQREQPYDRLARRRPARSADHADRRRQAVLRRPADLGPPLRHRRRAGWRAVVHRFQRLRRLASGASRPSGQVTEIDSAIAFAADSEPAGVSPGPDGNLWVTDDGD